MLILCSAEDIGIPRSQAMPSWHREPPSSRHYQKWLSHHLRLSQNLRFLILRNSSLILEALSQGTPSYQLERSWGWYQVPSCGDEEGCGERERATLDWMKRMVCQVVTRMGRQTNRFLLYYIGSGSSGDWVSSYCFKHRPGVQGFPCQSCLGK